MLQLKREYTTGYEKIGPDFSSGPIVKLTASVFLRDDLR